MTDCWPDQVITNGGDWPKCPFAGSLPNSCLLDEFGSSLISLLLSTSNCEVYNLKLEFFGLKQLNLLYCTIALLVYSQGSEIGTAGTNPSNKVK